MTPSELLALVGRAWVRLFVYPGGLSLFAAVWLAFAFAPALLNRKEREKRKESIFSSFASFALFAVQTSPVVFAAPWLAVALLPLPGAVDLGRGIDIVVVLALLDTPLLYALRREVHIPELRQRGVARLAAALNGYPPLLLSTLLLASGGSFELGQLMQPPAAFSVGSVMHWAGALGLVAALPPVVGFGPFTVPSEPAVLLALRLRAGGYWMLAALPWMNLLQTPWQALPPLLLALFLWAFHRATRRQAARVWARGYIVLAVLLLVILLAGALAQLGARLQ